MTKDYVTNALSGGALGGITGAVAGGAGGAVAGLASPEVWGAGSLEKIAGAPANPKVEKAKELQKAPVKTGPNAWSAMPLLGRLFAGRKQQAANLTDTAQAGNTSLKAALMQ